MRYRVGILYGDGIGPEVVGAAQQVLDAAVKRAGGVPFEWCVLPMGLDAIKSDGHPMPDRVKAALKDCHGWVMGPHDSVSYPAALQGERNPSGELRHTFGLYANIRPAKHFPSVPAVVQGMDVVVVRENTEEFYPDRNMFQGTGEWMPTPDMVISAGVFTRGAAERIARVAFELAQMRRKHVSIVHKANVIKLGMGLFLETCRTVGRDYPEVTVADYHIDAMAALLVRRPADFDVVVTTNMYGDILSDLTAELTGSLGLGGSLNHGADHAMAQAAHGSAPDIAGRGIANPIGEILSAAMLVRWLGGRHNDAALEAACVQIEKSVSDVLASGCVTPDLGGQATTEGVTERILEGL